ncbi:MAG: Asp-tRNA(Asn)/Glu-tRNA(Gln) amidotransferase subunit GatC [Thermoplasmata archaeon]|nr:Asp-tRNA(Asn)/Glu-tRNA(Gln) amidotransferase subunit GatC [Thermoplasmata archaeon]
MAEITPEEVAHVANLARLDVTEEELERFSVQLSSVLLHVETVRGLDIAEIPPTSHVVPLVNVLRPDVVGPGVSRDEVLAMAPESEDNRFKVPRILGEAP